MESGDQENGEPHDDPTKGGWRPRARHFVDNARSRVRGLYPFIVENRGKFVIGVLSSIVAGWIVMHFVPFAVRQAQQTDESQTAYADKLLERDLPAQALKLYDGLLERVPAQSRPSEYAHLQHMMGKARLQLAETFGPDREQDAALAVVELSVAESVYVSKGLRIEAALAHADRGFAYRVLADVRSDTISLAKAKDDLERALEVLRPSLKRDAYVSAENNLRKLPQAGHSVS